jgi:hypothetical protein
MTMMPSLTSSNATICGVGDGNGFDAAGLDEAVLTYCRSTKLYKHFVLLSVE